MPGHYTLDRGLSEVKAARFKFEVPGWYKSKDGTRKEKKAADICPIDKYDPTPIRGLKPPPRDSITRIPLAIQYPNGTYGWCDLTFNDILKVWGLVHKDDFNLFAIMLYGHAQHLVIDLDGDADVWPQLLGKEVQIEAQLRSLFGEFYETQFGTSPDMASWRADCVPAPEKGAPSKTSIHINHPGCTFATPEDLHEFVLRFVWWLVATHPDNILVSPGASLDMLKRQDDYKNASPIDVTVYSKNRKMRLAHASKPGKLSLMPMDPHTTPEDALWSSLVSYSMPADPATWLSYKEHTECDRVRLSSSNSSVGKKRSAQRDDAVEPVEKVQHTSEIVVASAEAGDLAVPDFKGTVCVLPPKESAETVDISSSVSDIPEKDVSAQGQRQAAGGLKDMADHFAAAMREEWDASTFFRFMPHPKPADVKLILTSLDQEKRLRGGHDTWRNVVWAIKAACPSDAGYAIVEEWTKASKPGSKRPGVLMKTWLSGKTDRFSIASLWKWVKEDRTGEEYKALWNKINPPEVMEAARKAAADMHEGAVARVVESWNQTFGKRNEQKELMFKTRTVENMSDDGEVKMVEVRELVCETRHELPHRSVMRWWSKVPAELIERIDEAGLMTQLIERTVLPMCNVYWKFLKEKKQDRIFVKQACDQPGDDRKWRWLEMTEKRFTGAAHTDFKLKDVHIPSHNMAHVWLEWNMRETYNGPACIPETAREEHRPAPYQFNEWIGLRVSHERARKEGDANHQDWLDFKCYLWNGFLQGEPDEQVKKYFCKWIISQVVRPGYKLKVALVMYSQLNQRGKGELIKVLGRILGDTVVKQCESENALDEFNETIAGKLLIALDEFKRCKQYNERAKIEITEPTREVNGKHDKVYTEPNCSNLAICTNEKDAVDVNVFSQRVFIVKILDGIETVLQKPDGTVVKYADWKGRKWNEVHLAAGMLDWAKELDLDNWDPTVIPVTEGAKLQLVAGEEKHDPVASWWRKFITNKSRVDEVMWSGWNSVAALFKMFKDDNADDHKVMREASSNWFSERMAERGFDKGNRRITKALREKAMFPEKQQMTQCFLLPSRETALAALNVKVRAGNVADEE